MATRSSAFISGSAAGIGLATARRLADAGWFVGIYDVDEAAARAAAAELGPARAVAGALDVRDPASWKTALAAFVAAANGRLDLLVNNAGIMTTGPFESIPLERQFAIVDVNAKGVLAGCYAALPYLRETPGARVINLCSASAIYGQPDMATYSATKFFVRGLTEALQIEWRGHGIRVASIWPLFVDTALVSGTRPLASMARLGLRLTAEDVAKIVVRAATAKRNRRTHWPVGAQTAFSMLTTRLGPPAAARFIVAKLAGR